VDIDKFIEQINDCFGEPFLEKDLVKAKRDSQGGGLCLRIGDRDIQFDDNLHFVGRGTYICKNLKVHG